MTCRRCPSPPSSSRQRRAPAAGPSARGSSRSQASREQALCRGSAAHAATEPLTRTVPWAVHRARRCGGSVCVGQPAVDVVPPLSGKVTQRDILGQIFSENVAETSVQHCQRQSCRSERSGPPRPTAPALVRDPTEHIGIEDIIITYQGVRRASEPWQQQQRSLRPARAAPLRFACATCRQRSRPRCATRRQSA